METTLYRRESNILKIQLYIFTKYNLYEPDDVNSHAN